MVYLFLTNNNSLSIQKNLEIGQLNINSSKNKFTDFKQFS